MDQKKSQYWDQCNYRWGMEILIFNVGQMVVNVITFIVMYLLKYIINPPKFIKL